MHVVRAPVEVGELPHHCGGAQRLWKHHDVGEELTKTGVVLTKFSTGRTRALRTV
jgi:hypothetical protein